MRGSRSTFPLSRDMDPGWEDEMTRATRVAVVGPGPPHRGGIVDHTVELVHAHRSVRDQGLTVQLGRDDELEGSVVEILGDTGPGRLHGPRDPEVSDRPGTRHDCIEIDDLP